MRLFELHLSGRCFQFFLAVLEFDFRQMLGTDDSLQNGKRIHRGSKADFDFTEIEAVVGKPLLFGSARQPPREIAALKVTLDAHFRVEHQGARQPYLLAEQALAQVVDFLLKLLQLPLDVRVLSRRRTGHHEVERQHQHRSPRRQTCGAAIQAACRQDGQQHDHARAGHRGAGGQVDTHGEIKAERHRNNAEANGQGKQSHHPVRHQARRHGWYEYECKHQ